MPVFHPHKNDFLALLHIVLFAALPAMGDAMVELIGK